MTYVGVLVYQGHVLFVVESVTNQVRLFEDEQLANDVVNIFTEDPNVMGKVITYEKYLALVNSQISPEEIFNENPVDLI